MTPIETIALAAMMEAQGAILAELSLRGDGPHARHLLLQRQRLDDICGELLKTAGLKMWPIFPAADSQREPRPA